MEINNINGEWEQKALFNELVHARELVKKLRIHLDKSSPTGELLLENALCSIDRALSTTTRTGWDVVQSTTAAGTVTGFSESPGSKNGSPRSDDSEPSADISKRRKTLPTWTEKICVGSATTGIEGSVDDGYSWRKYGQKDILGAKYPRSYYRCTYRNNQGCLATRQVQRSTANPFIFDVTYRGHHSCLQVSHLIPASHQNQTLNLNQNHQNHNQDEQKQKQSQEGLLLVNFEKGLRIKTEKDSQKPTSSSSSLFSFPASSSMPIDECFKIENNNFITPLLELNYLVPSSSSYNGQINVDIQDFRTTTTTSDQTDFNKTTSTLTSTTSSPTLDMDFELNPVDFEYFYS